MRRVSHEGLMLTTGALISDPISEPLRFEMEVGDPGYDLDPEYDGPPAEGPPWRPGLFDYYRNACVMHARLLETIKTCGGDNVQQFSALIERPETGDVYSDYFAINVIGLVSCADLAGSNGDPLGRSRYFYELAVAPSRSKELLLFRLAEYPPDVLVHETIARKLADAGFRGLRLDPVKH